MVEDNEALKILVIIPAIPYARGMDTSPFVAAGLVTLTALSPALVLPAKAERIDVRLVAYSLFEVVRHSEDNNQHARHSGHQPHAPATRIVSATVVSSTSGHQIIALPDALEYTRDAASRQIVEGLRFFYTHDVPPLAYRA